MRNHKDTLPSISVVIPTLNSERTLGSCLDCILKQDYPKEKIEIIISDGGSSDATIDIARSREVTKITTNPLVSGEAGKAIGVDNAMNDIVALIDSDNLLEDNAWLLKMVQPFKDHEIVSSEPLYWTYRSKDSHVNRYCALTGVNDPTCLFIGNYDRFSYLTGKWTDLPLKENDKGGYLKVTLYRGKVPTMGANGFLVRRSVLRKINYQPYLFDVDIVCQMIEVGYDTIARPKVGIIHLFSDDVKGFTKKTLRRVRDFVMFSSGKRRTYPWLSINKIGLARFILYTLTLFPLLVQSGLGYRKKPDKAWFLHPLLCWITLLAYIWALKTFLSEKSLSVRR